MADFVLVHGGLAGPGAGRSSSPNQRLGHRTHTLDLPIEDPAATLDDYAAVVVDVMRGLERPAWLVGHSMGGLVVPRAALAQPSAGLIFLCAGFPPTSEAEHEESQRTRNPGNEAHFIPAGEGRIMLSFESAAHDFFNDCPPELQRWAYERFRPQATAPFSDYAPIARYPDVPMHAIVGSDDNIVLRPEHSEMIRRRIGVPPIVLPGGHCPFVARPRVLAEVMHRMVGDAVTVDRRDSGLG